MVGNVSPFNNATEQLNLEKQYHHDTLAFGDYLGVNVINIYTVKSEDISKLSVVIHY